MSMLAALIGSSTVIRHVQHLILKVAENDAPVLITGEPGTKKETLARAVHEKSSRADGPFVPINCGSMSDDMLQKELLGEESKGKIRQGRIEVANDGTIFLDDVVKLSSQMQARLVALLQEGSYIPIGGSEQRSANVRVICSTGTHIDQAVREGKFREDLYYRLAGCAVYVPPLRERREDIGMLAEHFILKHSKSKSKKVMGIAPDAMSALLQHSWDYNIKELENLVERIVVLKNGGTIEVSDLPPRLRKLVTDDIDNFYQSSKSSSNEHQVGINGQLQPRNVTGSPGQQSIPHPAPGLQRNETSFPQSFPQQQGRKQPPTQHGFQGNNAFPGQSMPPGFEDTSEIDQFIKKEIDLGSGIDFYRVVEEFENRLIAEALRRTNHNKNRAAQLLSMNRTTLVEKLKKRAASSSVKIETGRVKRNPAFTIFDGLGNENREFESFDFIKENIPNNTSGK